MKISPRKFVFIGDGNQIILEMDADRNHSFDPEKAALTLAITCPNYDKVRVLVEPEFPDMERELVAFNRHLEIAMNAFLAARSMSARQREVFRLLTIGKSNKEISSQLCITVRTVKFHVSNLLEKFKCETRVDLVLFLHSARSRTAQLKVIGGKNAERSTAPSHVRASA